MAPKCARCNKRNNPTRQDFERLVIIIERIERRVHRWTAVFGLTPSAMTLLTDLFQQHQELIEIMSVLPQQADFTKEEKKIYKANFVFITQHRRELMKLYHAI